MATQIVCDGCGSPLCTAVELKDGFKELLVDGSRANGMQGGDPLPQGYFHWCEGCARVAFQAIKNVQQKAVGWLK